MIFTQGKPASTNYDKQVENPYWIIMIPTASCPHKTDPNWFKYLAFTFIKETP